MKKKLFYITIHVFMFLLLSFGVTAEETGNNPVAVSPGSEKEMVTVWQSCPTFSWSSVDHAASYRVVIFESLAGKIAPYESMAVMASPVISKQIPGPALSCTLSVEERLKTGNMYAWYVQALDASGNSIGSWSGGKIFKMEQETRFVCIQEKLAEILKSYGVSDKTAANINDFKSEVQEVEVNDAGSKNTPGISGILTEGTYNTTYGYYAGSAATGTNYTYLGASAGYIYGSGNAGNNNTILGHNAGRHNTSGDDNTFVGNTAGDGNTEGSQNTFIGRLAGGYNTTASYNTYIGYLTGSENITTGTRNSFHGSQAGHYCKGTDNTGIGYYAGYYRQYTDSASYNSFFGEAAGYNASSGNNNTYLGYHSGTNVYSGHDNALLGYLAGACISTGYNNTILGENAGYSVTTGIQNIFLGYNTAYNETGSNKLYIAVSNTSSPLIYGEFDNDIVTINGKLGVGTSTPAYPIEVSTTGSNSCIVVKRTDGATNYINATDSYANFGSVTDHPLRLVVNATWRMRLDSDGSLTMSNGATLTSGGTWTNASSRALKENIEDLSIGEAMAALFKLNPVKYNYKVDKTDKHVGFIAEDVPELVASADRKGLSPMDVTAVLTKVVQELEKENQEYTKILSELQERVASLEKE